MSFSKASSAGHFEDRKIFRPEGRLYISPGLSLHGVHLPLRPSIVAFNGKAAARAF
jgi:hypothetical protein